ncbi:MAG: hypothetical protein K2L36_02760 [Eubacterium sp.]|nr:hypothetical protein [Eubacterium sp.]
MKKVISTLIISAAAIIVGYGALALPFHLFTNLTGMQMRILFVAEIIIYFAIFSAFFLIRESRCEKKKKERELRERHNRRVSKRQNELKGINLNGLDIAA